MSEAETREKGAKKRSLHRVCRYAPPHFEQLFDAVSASAIVLQQPVKSEVFVRNLPSTEQLLISGGDARIALDPASGQNKYGCRPFPDPALLSFGSSTASVISEAGFAAADRLRQRLLQASGTVESVCEGEMQRIRDELLSDVSDLGTQLVFASSGTDAHFLAAQYIAQRRDSPLNVVMVQEEETGSGVLKALTGAGGGAVSPARVQAVLLRAQDGQPRPLADIDSDVVARVNDAVGSGMRVLLIMVDQSKTGLIAPGPSCAMALHRAHADKVVVLVDACQFRLAPPTLRAYLQQGFMVALTGSKFLTGPSFSAALLLPPDMAINDELQLAGSGGLGLLLRWEAALVEYRRFRALPQTGIADILQTLSRGIQARLMNDPHFESLAVQRLDRRPLTETESWDGIPTIFPFVLYHSSSHVGRVPLSRSETLQIYRQLQLATVSDNPISALRCQLGQPVACGVRAGVEVSALRLCVSARLVSDAATQLSGVFNDAQAALDKVVWLIDRLEQ